MTDSPYPVETLDDESDNGTMVENLQTLSDAVIGHRIASVEKVPNAGGFLTHDTATVITLDDGTKVRLVGSDDCCAYTEMQAFLLHPERVEHAILGVGTTGDYTTWHVYADAGDVLELTVGWSPGNPFYYGYGFDITVEPASAPA